MTIINTHVHMRSSIASAEFLEGMLDACDLDALAVACMSDWRGDRLPGNALGLWLKRRQPERVYALGGLHYPLPELPLQPPNVALQVRALIQAGFDGIKLIEGKPGVYKSLGLPLDGPYYAPLFAACEEAGLPVLLHLADPEELWDRDKLPAWAIERGAFLGDGTYPTKEQLYAQVEHILNRHPRLKLVLAHFYFMSADRQRLETFLAAHPNALVDVTPGDEMYFHFSAEREAWRAFFQQHRTQILLGTDDSGGHTAGGGRTAGGGQADQPGPDTEAMERAQRKLALIRRFLETDDIFTGFREELPVQGLALDQATLAAIYAGNWRRIAGERPRVVDVAAAHTMAQATLARLGDAVIAERPEALDQAREALQAVLADL